VQCREFCSCERELKHSGIYGEEERWGGRDNGLIQGKQCEPKLKRTDSCEKGGREEPARVARIWRKTDEKKEGEKRRERRHTPGVILVTAR
jgi:hypothetical protein